MSEIIDSMPWNCGDDDCEQKWHLRNFWAYEDGTFSVDEYADGDHHDIEFSELPDGDDVAASWREYHQHVAETGQDPLGQFSVKATRSERQRWEVKFARTIAGPMVVEMRRAGRRYQHGWEVPGQVADYLNISKEIGKRARVQGVTNDDLEDLGFRFYVWQVLHIDVLQVRPSYIVERELKSAARKALRTA